MAKTTPAEKPLSFGSILAADQKPTRIEFEIEGKPGFIAVQKLNFGDRNHFSTMGVVQKPDGTTQATDPAGRIAFLVSRSIVDWKFWIRPRLESGEPGELQEHSPGGMNRRERQLWLEQNVAEFEGEFGEFLVVQCGRVNGMTEEQEKNSPTPSAA